VPWCENLAIYTLIDVPHINQVHIFYRAELLDPDFAAGEESLEVRLFEEADIPWSELAFRTVSRTLECFFADRPGARSFPCAARLCHPWPASTNPNNNADRLVTSGIPL
jgi:hypothetical protein